MGREWHKRRGGLASSELGCQLSKAGTGNGIPVSKEYCSSNFQRFLGRHARSQAYQSKHQK